MRRAGALADRHSTALFLALAAGSALVVIGLGFGLTFFSDEWAFIEGRSLRDPATWWAPHNEHWSTIPVIVYGALLETAGLRSYVPYLVVLYSLHVVACAALFVLIRLRLGPVPALGAAALVLLLGAGFENLLWGFQIGFVGSTAAGLWALVVVDDLPTPKRRLALGALLLAGLASSGIGITFVVVVGTCMILRPAWRGSWAALGLPVAIFTLWFVLVGRQGIGTHRQLVNWETVVAVPEFVVGGFANAAGAVVGVGPAYGALAALVVLGAATLVALRHRSRRPVLALACAVGVAFQYALIAAARAGVSLGQVDYTRYTYLGALLLLVALADIGAPLALPQSPGRRLAAVGLVVLVAIVSLGWNLRLLVAGRAAFEEHAMTTRALVLVALDPAYSGAVEDDRSLVLVPAPRSLRALVARYGSPLDDAIAPWAVPPVTADDISSALERVDALR